MSNFETIEIDIDDEIVELLVVSVLKGFDPASYSVFENAAKETDAEFHTAVFQAVVNEGIIKSLKLKLEEEK